MNWTNPLAKIGKRPDGGTRGYPKAPTAKERAHRKRRRKIARASRQRNRRTR